MLKKFSRKKIKICIDALYLYRAANNRLSSINLEESGKNCAMSNRITTFLNNAINNNKGASDDHLIPLELDKDYIDILYTAVMINFTCASLIPNTCTKVTNHLEDLINDFTDLIIENILEDEKNENMQ